MTLLQSNSFLIALTFGVFFVGRWLQKRTGLVLLNPILVAIALLILFLKATDIPYDTYSEAGGLIGFWLKPAIVALGVPLYQQLRQIRQQLTPILVSQLVGCVVGVVSVVLTAKSLGASEAVIVSLAPKSVTTPIAMEVCSTSGGIPSLTAAIVVCVGLFGAVCGFKVLEIGRVRQPESQGIGMGTASHAVGTSRAMERGNVYGVYASLGLILNGVLTALITPFLLCILL